MRNFLAFLIFVHSTAFANDNLNLKTGASLPRMEFQRVQERLANSGGEYLISQLNHQFKVSGLIRKITERLHHSSSSPLSEANVTQVSAHLIGSLILSKMGYPEAAREHSLQFIINLGLVADELLRKTHHTADEVDEALSDVTQITIVETLKSLGYIKDFEMERMHGELDQLVQDLKKERGKSIRRLRYKEMTNTAFVDASATVAAVLGGSIPAAVVIIVIPELHSDLGLSTIVVAITAAILAGGAGAVGSYFAWTSPFGAYGWLRTRLPNFKKISHRCEGLLTSSKEILH